MANFFADRRAELELTQKQIADAAGYDSYAAVSAWEREISAPAITEAESLATAYKVTPARMREEIAILATRIATRNKKPAAAGAK